MRLKLRNTPEQVELIKAMGSKNQTVAREAQEAFAAFIGPVVQQVLNQAATASSIYTDAQYDEDDAPSFPLDLYYDKGADHVSVWSQSMAGGLPSSHVAGMDELKIATYRLDSAINMNRKYVRRARLDVVSKGVERMAQEILVKQERNAWAVVLKALADNSSNKIAATTAGVLQLNDFNKLMTRMSRQNESFANGTTNESFGMTDLYLSPEMVEQIRGFAYQPMNTRAAVGTADKDSTSIALPDSVRTEVFNSAGAASIYGVNINELNELGSGKKYNTLYAASEIGGSISNTEIAVGLDNSRGAFIRPVAIQSETGGEFNALADDQWSTRSDKVGFYGYLEEGRVCIDARAIVGLDL